MSDRCTIPLRIILYVPGSPRTSQAVVWVMAKLECATTLPCFGWPFRRVVMYDHRGSHLCKSLKRGLHRADKHGKIVHTCGTYGSGSAAMPSCFFNNVVGVDMRLCVGMCGSFGDGTRRDILCKQLEDGQSLTDRGLDIQCREAVGSRSFRARWVPILRLWKIVALILCDHF